MSDDPDYIKGLHLGSFVNTSGKDLTLEDVLAVSAKLSEWRDVSLQPHPVKVTLTEGDYGRLLEPWGVQEGVCKTVAAIFGIPVFYGDRSEIEWSDGTKTPL